MPHLLLNLRHVPDDEADEVRALLDANDIDWYETEPSRWGISHGGIWIREPASVASAKELMRVYQDERATRVRAEYAEARRSGNAESIWDVVRARPLLVLLNVIAILLMLGLVALPAILIAN